MSLFLKHVESILLFQSHHTEMTSHLHSFFGQNYFKAYHKYCMKIEFPGVVSMIRNSQLKSTLSRNYIVIQIVHKHGKL